MQINVNKSFRLVLLVAIVLAIYLVWMGYANALPSLFIHTALIYGGFHFLAWLRSEKLKRDKE